LRADHAENQWRKKRMLSHAINAMAGVSGLPPFSQKIAIES
jgi:hypothetical protein